MAHDHITCPFSTSFQVCTCGETERMTRLEQLEEERAAIERLIEGAETISLESSTSMRYGVRMVNARDLADVLAGRLR